MPKILFKIKLPTEALINLHHHCHLSKLLNRFHLPIDIFFLTVFFLFQTQTFAATFAADEIPWDIKLDPVTSRLVPTFVAVATEVSGDVFVKRGNETKVKIKKDVLLKVGDQFFTEKGMLAMKLIDETIIDLDSDSEFQIKSFEYESKNKRKAQYELKKGRLHAQVRIPVEGPLTALNGQYELSLKLGNKRLGLFASEYLANAEPIEVLLVSGRSEMRNELNTPYPLEVGEVVREDLFDDVIAKKSSFAKLQADELKFYGKIENQIGPFLRATKSAKVAVVNDENTHPQTTKKSLKDTWVQPKKSWQEKLLEHYPELKSSPMAVKNRSVAELEEKRAGAAKKKRNQQNPQRKVDCQEYVYYEIKGRSVPICAKFMP